MLRLILLKTEQTKLLSSVGRAWVTVRFEGADPAGVPS